MSMEATEQTQTRAASVARLSVWKRLVTSRVRDFASGELIIVDDEGELRLGTPAADGLRVHMRIHRPRLWRRVALGGLLAATEAYVDGDWDVDDLTALARLFSRNMDQVSSLDAGLGRLIRPFARTHEWLSRNSRQGSRRNIAAHYDLGNEFFEVMLDPTMTYSCGVFERSDATLEEASVAKIDRLCRKLDLGPSDHLLEIGSGWGALAIHAATKYGCQVTTTTISARQHEVVVRRVADAGLGDRISVLLADYRDLNGQFSKLVSVEMIEAVGAEFFDTFFQACGRLLRPDGLMALQAITVADQRFEDARRAVDFIKRHVFPGSCIPSVGALTSSSSRVSDMRLIDLEDFTPHYARTLAAWRDNLNQRRDEVARFADERFRRLWHLYLAYCEGGFAERHTGLVQMLLARPEWRGTVRRGAEVAAWTHAS